MAVVADGFEDWRQVSGCFFRGFCCSCGLCLDGVPHTISEVYLRPGCAGVHGLGGEVIAEFTGVDDVVGKCGTLAPILEIVRAGV